MPNPDGSLTVAEFRGQVEGLDAIEDDDLEDLLADVWSQIATLAGPSGEVTERHTSAGTVIQLTRRATSITSITEIDHNDVSTVLSTDDWSLRNDRRSLWRRGYGTNPSVGWVGDVVIVYEAEDDDATRRGVQRELAKLEITSRPGIAMLVVGNWTVQFQQGRTYSELKADILVDLALPDYGFA
jgi:hypothetical protein